MSESLPDGPPVERRPLPRLPPPGSKPRPISMPFGKPPAAPPRSESMEKWQPLTTSESDDKQKRSRPMIQVLDARPMSEVGFRGAGSEKQSVSTGSTLRNDGPDVTQNTAESTEDRLDVGRRPPPPARPPSYRHSMVTHNNQKNEDSGDIYSSKPLPPQPVSRALRPKSMLSKLPNPLQRNPQQDSLVHTGGHQVEGLDNDGFDSHSQRLADQQVEYHHDSNREDQNVPDLLTGDAEGMYKRDIDLLSDVPDEVESPSERSEETRRHRGVPVFPAGLINKSLPGSRGPPPPLPQKSPSVQNLNLISGETTLKNLDNNWENKNDDEWDNMGDQDKKTSPTPVPRIARGPTIIRPGARPSSASVKPEQTSQDTHNDHNSSHTITESQPETTCTNEKKLPPGVAGGVRIFPFALPKSRSEPESLKEKSFSIPSSTAKPAPNLKPKPTLMAKPALRPKPVIAPKPTNRPQSAVFPSHQSLTTHRDETPTSNDTEEDSNLPAKAPWQNELNARLKLRKTVTEKKEVTHTEVCKVTVEQKDQPKDEWDTDEVKGQTTMETKKPGPLKATYRPTIIRAAVPAAVASQPHKEEEPVVEPRKKSPPRVINKRFSTSCVDMRSTGADMDLKMWAGPNQYTDTESNNYNNHIHQQVSKDDSYKPSSNVEMRQRRGPTIIRPPSLTNLSRAPVIEAQKTSPAQDDSWGDSGVVQQSSWETQRQSTESSWETRRQSTQAPPRPRPPSPVAMRRRRSSSGVGEEFMKAPSNPVQRKKSSTGKNPPPRPASGPRRDSVKRSSASTDQQPLAGNRMPSAGSDAGPVPSPSFPHGVALFDYNAQHDDEISFKKGETVQLVHSESPEWMCGRLGRREGIFPVNFIQVVIPPPDKPAASPPQKVQNTVTSPPPRQPQGSPPAPTGPHCIAIHDYNSGEASDLVFRTDDVITLLERVGEDWLKGECQGHQGIFPVTFVSIVQHLPPNPPETVVGSLNDADSSTKTASKNMQGFGLAIHDFSGQEEGDLPFWKGDRIRLMEQVDSDWLRGEVNGRQGVFPASFVEIETDGAPVVDDAPPPLPSSPPPLSPAAPPPCSLAVVLYPFPGEAEGDLPLSVGDEVEVLETIDTEWMRGRVEGREGIFPAAFVEVFT